MVINVIQGEKQIGCGQLTKHLRKKTCFYHQETDKRIIGLKYESTLDKMSECIRIVQTAENLSGHCKDTKVNKCLQLAMTSLHQCTRCFI